MSSPLRQSSSSGQQGSLSHLQARREDVHRERREQLQHQHHEQRGLEANSASSSYDDRMSSNAHFQRAPMEQRPHHHEQRPHHHEQRYHFSEQRDQQHSGQQDKLSTSDRYSAWKEQHRQSTYESSSYGSDSRAQPDYPAAATRTTPAYDIRSLEHPPFMPQRSLLTGHAPRQDMQDSLARSRDAVEPTLSPSLRNPQAMSASHEGRSGQPPFNWPERSMADVSPHSSRGELSQPSGPPSMPESQTPSVLAPSVPAPPPAWRPTADEHEQSAIERPGGNAATPICSNCSTLTTPLWRRDGRGGLLCNACGLFVRVKGRPRPVSMKTDVIKSRARRSKVGLPLVGSGAAAAAPDYSIPENARYGSSQDAYRSRDMPGEGSSPETSMSLDRSEESGSWRDGYASREFAASSRMTSGPQGWSNNPESLARPRLPPYGHAGSPREHEPFQPSPSSYGSSVYEGRRSDYFDDTREPLRSSRYPGQGPEPSFAPPAGPPPMLPSTSRIDQQMRLGPSADFAPPSGWRGARLPPLMSETEASNPRLPALLHSSFPPPMRRSSFDRGVVGGAPTLPSPSMNHSDPVDGPSVGSLVRRRSSDSRSAPYPKRRFDEAPPSMQSRPMSSIVDGPPPRLPGLHALQRSSDGPGGSFRLPPLSSLTGTPTGRLSPSDSMQQRRDPMRES